MESLKILYSKKSYYHIPLVYLGLVNFAMKTDAKILFGLQRNMNKLFETRAKADSVPEEPDALIQFHDRPYIAYQEINLTQTFNIYLSGVLRSETALKVYSFRFENLPKCSSSHKINNLKISHSYPRNSQVIYL